MTSLKLICSALLTSALAFACTDPSEGTAAAAVSDPADAGAGSGGSAKPPPPKPPQESIDACASKSAGDACSFTLGGNTLTGTCTTAPDGNGPLGCKPDQPPPPPKPPQQAVDACTSKSAGDACSFTCGSGAVDGTCLAPPDGSSLACAPPRP